MANKVIITRITPKPVPDTVEISLTFTEEQFVALTHAVVGKGLLKGAWNLLWQAAQDLSSEGFPAAEDTVRDEQRAV